MLSNAPEQRRAFLVDRLLKAFEHPEVKLEEHPRLQQIQRQLNAVMGSSETEGPTTLPMLSTEEITALSHQLHALPRPILNRDRQAFIRILNKNVTAEKEFQKIQTSGVRHVSPMTLVGQHAPFVVYDQGDWKNRSGLVFSSETSHVAGHKQNFLSNKLAGFLEDTHRAAVYRAAFDLNPAGDPAQLYPLVNEAFNNQLSELTPLQKKYVEMDARRQSKIPDRSSKHELVDFLKTNCRFNDREIRPFADYHATFYEELAKETDPAKRERLSQAALKLASRDPNAQIKYLERGAAPPEGRKYQGLNAFRHNEHLCLPQTGDVEGAYVNLSSEGMAHALSLQDALVATQFERNQQRLYAYHPGVTLSLVSREEIESLQGVIQGHESRKIREQTQALLAKHQSQFPDLDSRVRLRYALLKAGARSEASALSFSSSEILQLPHVLQQSLFSEALDGKNYPLVRTLFSALPPQSQASSLKDSKTLVGLIAAFGKDPQGLSDLKSLIDANQIDLHHAQWPDPSLVHGAVQGCHVDAFPVLKAWKVNLNEADLASNSPAHRAAELGHVEVIRALADSGANLDLKQSHRMDQTPAHIAACRGHAKVIKALADGGANLNQADYEGKTPAHWAATRGNIDALKGLAERGANLNQADRSGRTPTHFAAEYGHAEVIKVLAERGADLNQACQRGWTPAHSAAMNGQAEAIIVLAEQGANLSKAKTPLACARSGQHLNVIDALHRHAGIFDSRDHAQKTLEKKLVLWISAVTGGADPHAAIHTIPGLHDFINAPDADNRQRLYDRLLASESFSYRKQSTGYLVAHRATLTPAVRMALLHALGDTGIVSSLHQERKKIDDWCAVPEKHQEAQQKIENHTHARSVDIANHPAQNAHTLKSFAIDIQRIDQWLGQIQASCGKDSEPEKFNFKGQLLKAYHSATLDNPAQAAALQAAYQALPSFESKESLWQKVTA